MSRRKKHASLNFHEPILPGSISPSYLACGKSNCSCAGTKPVLHGPYYRWTGLIDNKRKTITLHSSIVEECQKRIENYKKLLLEFEKVKKAALKNAPWNNMQKKNPP
jgi:hypothetical protein